MRKRKLYLSELLKRYKSKHIQVLINNGYYYDTVIDCLQQIKNSYMWELEVQEYEVKLYKYTTLTILYRLEITTKKQ